jgi:hypothetical protein
MSSPALAATSPSTSAGFTTRLTAVGSESGGSRRDNPSNGTCCVRICASGRSEVTSESRRERVYPAEAFTRRSRNLSSQTTEATSLMSRLSVKLSRSTGFAYRTAPRMSKCSTSR